MYIHTYDICIHTCDPGDLRLQERLLQHLAGRRPLRVAAEQEVPAEQPEVSVLRCCCLLLLLG